MEEVALYLDALEENVPEHATPAHLRPKPAVLGTPVDFDKHRQAFERKWEKFIHRHETYIEPEPPEPLVKARTAQPEEIPDSARRCIEFASARGAVVSTSYAQGGEWRESGKRCICSVCEAEFPVKEVEDGEDGTHTVCKAHSAPKTECPSSDATLDAVGAQNGVQSLTCPTCGLKVRVLKRTGTIAKHDGKAEQCSGSERPPVRIVPSKQVEPVKTVVVRVKGTGVAVYEDGGFKFAYVKSDVFQARDLPTDRIVKTDAAPKISVATDVPVWLKVGATEWEKRCKVG